jgi:PAS domain S-box-containing protein
MGNTVADSKSNDTPIPRAPTWWADKGEDKLLALLEQAPSVIVGLDLEKRIQFINRDLLFNKKYKHGDSVLDHANEIFREQLESLIDHVFDTGELMEFESHGFKPDGDVLYYTNQLAPIAEKGKIMGATLVTTDITEQVKSRKEFEFAKERLEKAQEIAKVGSWEWNIADGSIWWSDELYLMYNLDRGDVRPTFKKFLSKVHPNDRGIVEQSVADAVAGNSTFNVECRLVFSAHDMLYVHTVAHLTFDDAGKPKSLRGIAQDVTGRRSVEEALKQSRAMLAEAQGIAHLGSSDWDVTLDTYYWSDETYRIFGYDPQSFEPTSTSFLDLVHHEDREEVFSAANRAIKDRLPYTIAHRIILDSGEVRYLSNSSKSFEDHAGNLVRVVRTLQDVTARKKSEVELAMANKLLLSQSKREQKMKSRALIVGMEEERARVSRELHDGIGQMLSAVKFTVGRLASSEALTELGQQNIDELKEIIDMSIAETIAMSNNLMPSVLRDFGLKPAIQKIIKHFESDPHTNINFKGSHDSVRLPKEIETGLYRITQEAVNNAMKYANASNIEVLLSQTDQHVHLEISDNGEGFKIDVQQDDVRNFGNGLINMKERVVMMGGRFKLMSNLGNGTKVIINVPIQLDGGV